MLRDIYCYFIKFWFITIPAMIAIAACSVVSHSVVVDVICAIVNGCVCVILLYGNMKDWWYK